MEREITVEELLEAYKKYVAAGDIQFLEKGSVDQDKTLQLVKDLQDEILKARRTSSKGSEDFSQVLDWRAAHEKGRSLWEKLISCALNNIDRSSKGTSNLLNFLEPATNFEDVLYGLELYYRDHTLHSLWVYLIGEYILRRCLPDLSNNLEWYLYDDIEKEYQRLRTIVSEKRKSHKRDYQAFKDVARLRNTAKGKKAALVKEVNEHRDAIWCVMALCHDLGYSFEKLGMLNQKVLAVLEFLDLSNFKHVGYSLDVEHQYLVSQFLELTAMDVRIVPSEQYDDALFKCYRDDEVYWRLCQALEKSEHGILSSYLVFKNLGIFAKSTVRGPSEEWGLEEEDDEPKNNIILGNILFGIAQHTFEFKYLNHLSSLADILVLADDLEEFSRYGRKMLSRNYNDTMANVKVEFRQREPEREKLITIKITYKVEPHVDLRRFFSGKAKDLYRTYSLDRKSLERKEGGEGTISRYEIDGFEICAEQGVNRLSFCFRRDSGNDLGVNVERYAGQNFEVTSRDDRLLCDSLELSAFLGDDDNDKHKRFKKDEGGAWALNNNSQEA